MFGGSWRLGRILGIEVRIDTSWVLIALLVTYSLYVRFDLRFPELTQAANLLLAILFGLLFFASVLGHEMAHAVTARRRGIEVRGITLFLFGGATHARVDSRRPQDELVISAVGPLTSLILGGLLLLLAQALGGPSRPVAGGFRYLGAVNIMLAIFNMLPGFPLDGGRVLRAIVWRATGSLSRATRVAGISGQILGYLLVGGGVVLLAAGALGTAIWIAAIGWFLAQAARTSQEDLRARMLLEDVDAEELMTPELITVPADLSVRGAVDDYFMRHDHGAFPVEDDGRTVGLITLRGVKRVPQPEWGVRRVRDVMDPLGDQLSVPVEARMDQVLAKLQEAQRQRVLVVRDGQVVGIITPSDISRWLERRQALMR
jgi:Zn-dependent protease/predicted transcriptional regulator